MATTQNEIPLERVGLNNFVAIEPWLTNYVLPAAELFILSQFRPGTTQTYSNNTAVWKPLALLQQNPQTSRPQTRRQTAMASDNKPSAPDKLGAYIGNLFITAYTRWSGKQIKNGKPVKLNLKSDATNTVQLVQQYGTKRVVYHAIAVTTGIRAAENDEINFNKLITNLTQNATVTLYTLVLGTNPPKLIISDKTQLPTPA